jgi:hypothetical protein
MAQMSPQIRLCLRSNEVLVFSHRGKRVALLVWQLQAQFSTWCAVQRMWCSHSWLQMERALNLELALQALKDQLEGCLQQSALR